MTNIDSRALEEGVIPRCRFFEVCRPAKPFYAQNRKLYSSLPCITSEILKMEKVAIVSILIGAESSRF